MSTDERRKVRMRKAAGAAWLVAWITMLYVVAAPWRHLGGLVDERLRWLEWCVLVTALPIGFTTGRFAREAAVANGRWTHLRLLRILLYPPAILTALGLVTLTWIGQRGPIGVLATVFLAYWAGLDIAFGAVPLMEGRSYRFDGALDPEPRPPMGPSAGVDRDVEWERFLSGT